MTKPACKDCFWWNPLGQHEKEFSFEVAGKKEYGWSTIESGKIGHCHLRPPISGKQPWPQVLPTDFCRSFKDKEQED